MDVKKEVDEVASVFSQYTTKVRINIFVHFACIMKLIIILNN